MALRIEPYDFANNAANALQVGSEAVGAALLLVYEQHPDQFPGSWDLVQDFLTGTARLEQAQAAKLVELLQTVSDDLLAASSPQAVLAEPALRAYFGPRLAPAADTTQPEPEQAAPSHAADDDEGGTAPEWAWIAPGSGIYRSGASYYLREGAEVWQVVAGDDSEFHDGAHYYDAMGRMATAGQPASGRSPQELLGALAAAAQRIEGIDLLSDREVEMIIGAVFQEPAVVQRIQGREQI